jgi:hypothetical protein
MEVRERSFGEWMLAETSGGRGLKAAVRAVVCPAAIAMLCAVLSSGQSTVSTHPASAPAKPATHPKRKRVKAAPEPVVPVAVAPAEPPAPKWPVNDPSVPARVSWNGRELIVTATNASLSQVLHEVSSATGLKVEGLDSSRDQRIFGVFGPAEAKDVLNQLLDGAGYNVIILGDRGAGNPRELVLASQTKGGSHPANVNRPGNQPVEEEVPEEPEQQPEPERPQQGPPPPGVRPAAQYLQDLRNQQQQQQLPNPGQNPTQTPPN